MNYHSEMISPRCHHFTSNTKPKLKWLMNYHPERVGCMHGCIEKRLQYAHYLFQKETQNYYGDKVAIQDK